MNSCLTTNCCVLVVRSLVNSPLIDSVLLITEPPLEYLPVLKPEQLLLYTDIGQQPAGVGGDAGPLDNLVPGVVTSIEQPNREYTGRIIEAEVGS